VSIDFLLHNSHLFVNRCELPLPRVVIEEGTVIESIVVGAVCLRVAGRSQYRHLMTIYSVTSVEMFYFIGNLK